MNIIEYTFKRSCGHNEKIRLYEQTNNELKEIAARFILKPCENCRPKTTQELIQNKLKELNYPYIDIDVYGDQICITCKGQETSKNWTSVLIKFCKRVKIVETLLETKNSSKHNFNPIGKKYYSAYRIFGTI